ncbi:MAG: hypothetical protein GY754_44800 [bacterium]|nr:hypothetical protein [bacterium]
MTNEEIFTPETPVVEEAKSRVPRVIGILLIVTGSLYIFCGLIPGIMSLLGSFFFDAVMGESGIGEMFGQMLPGMQYINRVQGFVSIISGLAAIIVLVAGIGLLQYKEKRGRKLAIVAGIISFGYLVFEAIITYTVILPAHTKMMASFPGGGMFNTLAPPMSIATVMSFFFQAVFPVVLIILMTRSFVKESCEG